jgi:hypothetical protein
VPYSDTENTICDQNNSGLMKIVQKKAKLGLIGSPKASLYHQLNLLNLLMSFLTTLINLITPFDTVFESKSCDSKGYRE